MKSEVVILTKAYRQEDTLDLIHHYQKLGFDHITLYLNDYEPVYEMTDENYKNVSMYLVKGFPNQLQIYDNHYSRNTEYDWIFFCDDDEYLRINKSKWKNINEFLLSLDNNVKVFGVYWQFASYKDGCEIEDRTQSMSQSYRYTPEGEYLTHYKSFVRKGQVGGFKWNPHTFMTWSCAVNTVDGLMVNPEEPYKVRDPSKDDIKLVHYWRKSKKEMERKMGMLTPDHITPTTYEQVKPEHKLNYTKKL